MTAIVINEVGLRDGLQNQPHFVATSDKLRLLDALLGCGLRHFEVTSFVSPRAVPQMADAADLMAQLPQRADVDFSVLVPNLRGYDRALAAGARSIAMVLSCTETMNRRNIGMSLDAAVAATREVVGRASREGVTARVYLAVAFDCPFEGPTPIETVLRLADAVMGPCEILVADTIGAAAPFAVERLFAALRRTVDVSRLSAHFHDTRGLACANAFAALQAGVRKFDAAIGGLGGCPFAPGASGNLATEDLVHLLEAGGYKTGIDPHRLGEAVAIAEAYTGAMLGGDWLKWKRSQTNNEKASDDAVDSTPRRTAFRAGA